MKGRIEAVIKGLVQGVSFRYYCSQEARRFGLSGYTTNLPEGNIVMVVAEGELSNLKKLVEWLKSGPDNARVEDIIIEQKKYTGEFKNFEIR